MIHAFRSPRPRRRAVVTVAATLTAVVGGVLSAHPAAACFVVPSAGSWDELQAVAGPCSSGSVYLTADIVADPGERLDLASALMTIDLQGFDLTIVEPSVGQAAVRVIGSADVTFTDSSTTERGALTLAGGAGAAALGGDTGQSAGAITIDGVDTVTATGGAGGAGIGGGSGGAGGNIDISGVGDQLTATGGGTHVDGGAGIGGGAGGAGGTIAIHDNTGIIEALAPGDGAGVGGGAGGAGAAVAIHHSWTISESLNGPGVGGSLSVAHTPTPDSGLTHSDDQPITFEAPSYAPDWAWVAPGSPANRFEIVIGYRVTLDLAGGSLPDGTTEAFVNAYDDPRVDLPAPTKPGFDFVGWTSSGEWWDLATDLVVDDITLVAQYAPVATTTTTTATTTTTTSSPPESTTTTTAAPGAAPAVHLSVAAAVQGAQVTVTGSGLTPGEQARVELHSDPIVLGTFTADATGSLSATVTIPASVPPGAHQVVVIGLSSGVTVQAALTVSGGTPSAELPETGRGEGSQALVAAGLLLAGAGLVLLGRRRGAQPNA